MAQKAKKTSHRAKVAGIAREIAGHERAIARLHNRLEVAEAAAETRVERELARVERKLGIKVARSGSRNESTAKPGKKRAKKAAKKAAKAPSAKARGKKRAKRSNKKTTKKTAKRAAKAAKAPSKAVRGIVVEVFEDLNSRKPGWVGPLDEFIDENEFSPLQESKLRRLGVGDSVRFDQGAGGEFRVRRKR